MDNKLKIVIDNITDIYKDQSKKIKNKWEYQAIWSYLDRLIDMQVISENLFKAKEYNDHLFSEYTKGDN